MEAFLSSYSELFVYLNRSKAQDFLYIIGSILNTAFAFSIVREFRILTVSSITSLTGLIKQLEIFRNSWEKLHDKNPSVKDEKFRLIACSFGVFISVLTYFTVYFLFWASLFSFVFTCTTFILPLFSAHHLKPHTSRDFCIPKRFAFN